MAQYCHAELSSNQIRLLRLMRLPENETTESAKIHCEVFAYPLNDEIRRTHQYEALSYSWGGEKKPCSIFIGGQKLDVTENLYAALSCLRRRHLDRIIWVDAVCINQTSTEERSQQVQLMATIYSKAYCVIVWLGTMADDVEGALEWIQEAAEEEPSPQSTLEWIQEAAEVESSPQSTKDVNVVSNLLQRQWFQRVWVLQEVAAARHVVLVCGSTEIDGYAFCVGLEAMQNSKELSHSALPELHSLPSLTSLIKRAGLRPKGTTKSPQKYSLEISSLAELVDRFHTRQASDPRDKVYALLGMSSDNPSEAGLQPDYDVTCEELFQRLVMYVLGPDASVKAIGQKTAIKSRGYILGQVDSVSRNDRQLVEVYIESHTPYRRTMWVLQASAQPIHKHDIVCILSTALKPTIIRPYKDRLAIVVIAATPLNYGDGLEWPRISESMQQSSRDFLLFWDLKDAQGDLENQEDVKVLIEACSEGQSDEHLREAIQAWNYIMILDDLGESQVADQKIQEARDRYVIVLGKKCLPRQISEYGRTLLSFAAGEGHEDVVRLLLMTTDPNIKDSKSGRTPLYLAARNGHEAVVNLLLKTGKVDADSTDNDGYTPLRWAVRNGHETVVKMLLGTDKIDADFRESRGQTPLHWAVRNGHETIVKLLLETGKVKVDSRDIHSYTPLRWAIENGYEAIFKLLLEVGKIDIDSKDENGRTLLHWAAIYGQEAILQLLLKTGKVNSILEDFYGRTPRQLATANGHRDIARLLCEISTVKVDSKRKGNWKLFW